MLPMLEPYHIPTYRTYIPYVSVLYPEEVPDREEIFCMYLTFERKE